MAAERRGICVVTVDGVAVAPALSDTAISRLFSSRAVHRTAVAAGPPPYPVSKRSVYSEALQQQHVAFALTHELDTSTGDMHVTSSFVPSGARITDDCMPPPVDDWCWLLPRNVEIQYVSIPNNADACAICRKKTGVWGTGSECCVLRVVCSWIRTYSSDVHSLRTVRRGRYRRWWPIRGHVLNGRRVCTQAGRTG